MDFGQFFFNAAGNHGGMPLGRFEAMYKCHSVAFIHRPDLEFGGKIILPPSALDTLTRLHIEYPMLFELAHPNMKRKMHCGVQEFIAEEGIVYMPFWMMQNLLIEEGSIVQIKSTRLSLGNFVKFQPHTSNFLDISNPKAVLENSLRKFSALTKGDVIVINYNNRNYYLTVLETKPADAISILETDISVDFAPPLDYKEPVRPTATTTTSATPAMSIPGKQPQRNGRNQQDDEEEEAKNKFRAFGGSGSRLDGKPITPSPSPTPSPLTQTSTSFGSRTGTSLPKGGPSPSSSPATKLTFGNTRPVARQPTKEDSEDSEEEEEEEEDKKKKFVPFGGKGYTLK